MNIKNNDDLLIEIDVINTLKKFGTKLPNIKKIGVSEYDKFIINSDREEKKSKEKYIIKKLKSIFREKVINIVTSSRKKKRQFIYRILNSKIKPFLDVKKNNYTISNLMIDIDVFARFIDDVFKVQLLRQLKLEEIELKNKVFFDSKSLFQEDEDETGEDQDLEEGEASEKELAADIIKKVNPDLDLIEKSYIELKNIYKDYETETSGITRKNLNNKIDKKANTVIDILSSILENIYLYIKDERKINLSKATNKEQIQKEIIRAFEERLKTPLEDHNIFNLETLRNALISSLMSEDEYSSNLKKITVKEVRDILLSGTSEEIKIDDAEVQKYIFDKIKELKFKERIEKYFRVDNWIKIVNDVDKPETDPENQKSIKYMGLNPKLKYLYEIIQNLLEGFFKPTDPKIKNIFLLKDNSRKSEIVSKYLHLMSIAVFNEILFHINPQAKSSDGKSLFIFNDEEKAKVLMKVDKFKDNKYKYIRSIFSQKRLRPYIDQLKTDIEDYIIKIANQNKKYLGDLGEFDIEEGKIKITKTEKEAFTESKNNSKQINLKILNLLSEGIHPLLLNI